MAREKQLPLFDLEGDDNESKPGGTRRFTSWEEVARNFVQLLREANFGGYLDREETQEPDEEA